MKIKIDQGKVNTINFPSCEKELNEMKKNSYREHNIKELILLEHARFEKHPSNSYNAILVPNTKYIVFSHRQTEYEEAIKHSPYIYHPEIKNIKIQIIFYDDESTIFRSFDNPVLN
tara:strand:- start:786 stop:1133 length:348 start_codon:yes stop_codon:yes gene_type:complete